MLSFAFPGGAAALGVIGLGTGAIFPIALGRAMDFSPQGAAISFATLLMGVIAGLQIAALGGGFLSMFSIPEISGQ